MRITDIEVDGFGVWSGLKLADLSDELNVVYGPNEAGKTTLLQFVRSILYGFSPERRDRYLPPLRPGRPGGALRVVAAGERLSIRRHADNETDTGEPAIHDERGVRHDARRLEELLGGVDEPVFTNVFAVGLREMQQLATLGDTEAAHFLYDLTLGLDRVSLVDVVRELETARSRLLAVDGRPSLVGQLLGQRARLESEIEELAEITPRYFELLSQRGSAGAEISRLEGDCSRLAEQVRAIDLARSLSQIWRRRAEAQRGLVALGPAGRLPDNATRLLDELTGRIANRVRRRLKLKRRWRQLQTESESLAINEALCRSAPRLEALNEQQQWISTLADEIAQGQDQVAQLQLSLEADHQQLGLTVEAAGAGPKIETLRALKPALKAQAKAMREVSRRKREAAAEEAENRSVAQGVAREIQAALGKHAQSGLTSALSNAGGAVSQLRRRVQLDERLDQMSRHEAELDEQSHELLEQQLLPTWVLVSLGALFVLGCALILLYLAGLLLPASISKGLGWPLALLGVAGMGVAGLWKFYMERSAANRLEANHRQLAQLREQIAQGETERDDLDRLLPRGGGPLVTRLQTAEAELAGLEKLLPLEAKRETAERQADAAHERRREARRELAKLRERWQQLLVEGGLPEKLAPKQLGDFFRRGQQIRQSSQQLAALTEQLTQRKSQYQILTGRISQVALDVGISPAAKEPLGQLRELLGHLREQELRVRRREALQAELARLRRKWVLTIKMIKKLGQRRERLLGDAGADDEAQFRQLAQKQDQRQQLLRLQESLTQEISVALASQPLEQEARQYLESPDDLEQAAARMGGQLQTARGRLEKILEARGGLTAQIDSLAADRRRAEKQLDLAIVEQRLKEAIERWRVLAVCCRALESVREVYERERQPAALRQASGYLREFTAGRYTRVWTPLGEQRLKVDDAAGNSLPVEVLSRGTREQLFLSLRLALVSGYAERGVRLPLILDDVLVNFDVQRTLAAAMVLREFARSGHQLLVFTCHEHIARIFQDLKLEVRQLPANSEPHVLLAAKPSPVEEPASEPTPARFDPAPILDIVTDPAPVAATVEPVRIEPERRERPRRTSSRKALPAPAMVESRVAPTRLVGQHAWSAEEFAGELADRVRQSTTGEILTEPMGQRSSNAAEEAA